MRRLSAFAFRSASTGRYVVAYGSPGLYEDVVVHAADWSADQGVRAIVVRLPRRLMVAPHAWLERGRPYRGRLIPERYWASAASSRGGR